MNTVLQYYVFFASSHHGTSKLFLNKISTIPSLFIVFNVEWSFNAENHFKDAENNHVSSCSDFILKLCSKNRRMKQISAVKEKPFTSSLNICPETVEHRVGRVLSVSPVVGIGTPPPL